MADIYAKQNFTMRHGDIRVSWRSTQNIADEDVIDFITKDTHYSEGERWKNVFDVLKFDSAENNNKYKKFLKGSNRLEVDNASVTPMQSDNGKIDKRALDYDFARNRKIEEFMIMNDSEKTDIINYFKNSEDFDALASIQQIMKDRGDSKWANDIQFVFSSRDIRKAADIGNDITKEIDATAKTKYGA